MDTEKMERIDRDIDYAIRELEFEEALEFCEELASRLEGKIDGLRDDIEALKAEEEEEETAGAGDEKAASDDDGA